MFAVCCSSAFLHTITGSVPIHGPSHCDPYEHRAGGATLNLHQAVRPPLLVKHSPLWLLQVLPVSEWQPVWLSQMSFHHYCFLQHCFMFAHSVTIVGTQLRHNRKNKWSHLTLTAPQQTAFDCIWGATIFRLRVSSNFQVSAVKSCIRNLWWQRIQKH